MDKQRIAEIIMGITGPADVRIDEPMKNHTSFKLGGPADLLVTPDSPEKLGEVYRFCLSENLPVFVMGNGTNLVVRDKGIRGVVLKIYDNLDKFEVRDDTIVAEAGLLLSRVSKIALEYGLAGLEFAEGIPGTLGGAVAMNAGAYIGEMVNVVVRTDYLDMKGNPGTVCGAQHKFGKRTSFIQQDGGIVLKSEMKLRPGSKEEIKALMDNFNKQRRDKQPLEMPSAGSIFKRPEGHFAGKLIEDCNLRGYRIGGAEVSNKHCGFIVNAGNATAEDVTSLIKHIQNVVMDRFGVELHTEVKVVGEE